MMLIFLLLYRSTGISNSYCCILIFLKIYLELIEMNRLTGDLRLSKRFGKCTHYNQKNPTFCPGDSYRPLNFVWTSG